MVAICDDSYEPESAYERARKKNDPLFAPHGHFATLKPDSILQAVEFVKEFGPLEERGMPKSFEDLSTSRLCYVDLDEFGVRQFEFDCVCRLWCARNSTELMTAWRGIHERAVQLQRSIDTIGKNYDDEDPEVILGENLDFLRSADIPFPFRHSSNFETWLKDRPSSKLRPETMDWISEELNRHSGETRLTWDYHQAGDDYRFRTRPRASSLWQIIWTFFGLDISDRGLWRICPHCQQMFYPKRRDQFYCTPRQQALASKREWWHKNKKRAK